MEKEKDYLLQISDLTVQYNTDDAVVHSVNHFNLNLVRGEARGLVGKLAQAKPQRLCPSCGCCLPRWAKS